MYHWIHKVSMGEIKMTADTIKSHLGAGSTPDTILGGGAINDATAAAATAIATEDGTSSSDEDDLVAHVEADVTVRCLCSDPSRGTVVAVRVPHAHAVSSGGSSAQPLSSAEGDRVAEDLRAIGGTVAWSADGHLREVTLDAPPAAPPAAAGVMSPILRSKEPPAAAAAAAATAVGVAATRRANLARLRSLAALFTLPPAGRKTTEFDGVDRYATMHLKWIISYPPCTGHWYFYGTVFN